MNKNFVSVLSGIKDILIFFGIIFAAVVLMRLSSGIPGFHISNECSTGFPFTVTTSYKDFQKQGYIDPGFNLGPDFSPCLGYEPISGLINVLFYSIVLGVILHFSVRKKDLGKKSPGI